MKLIFTLILSISCFSAFCQYNFYFGNIHSHSSYSDGNRDSTATGYFTPADDYNYAKATYHMDFLGISEHNHYTDGMRVANYARGMYQADTSNRNGTFVSMYGQEWGTMDDAGGHVVTYGVPGLIGWETGFGLWGGANNYDIFCAKGDFTSFWPIVKSYPTAFCTLAHPRPGDYGNLLVDATAYNTVSDSVVVGISVRSGNELSTTTDYTDHPATSYESNFLYLLSKGYHAGPTIDHDNHYTTFGRTNQSRTVVLASSLNRDSIMAAYKANRFYASDDWNVQVNFTVNGNFMGSDFTCNNNSSIFVSVNDPDAAGNFGDHTSKIEIYYGIPGSYNYATVLVSNTGSNNLSYTHVTSQLDRYYYFAKITQVGGDIIWTSPIWVYKNTVTLPIELVKFTGIRQKEKIKLNWTTSQEINADYFEIERSADGTHFEKIGKVSSKYHTVFSSTDYEFFDASAVNGINFYRLKQVDLDRNFKYSDILPVMFNHSIVQTIKVNPNPVGSNLNMELVVDENAKIICKIYNADGREVKVIAAAVFTGKNIISANVDGLANGNYIVVIINNDERVAETKFIKQ